MGKRDRAEGREQTTSSNIYDHGLSLRAIYTDPATWPPLDDEFSVNFRG
jgi:hypothetical protein